MFKLKAFADDKIILNKKLKRFLGREESILGKGENACYQHFLLYTQCFSKPSLKGLYRGGKSYPFPPYTLILTHWKRKSIGKHYGKK